MSNPFDQVSGGRLLSFAKQADRIKESAGRADTDVDKGTNNLEDNDVLLTDLARHMRAIEQQLEDIPVIDREKVEDLRRQVVDGGFHVDARGIATKLLDADRLLD